jgi:hypothetical protein
MLHAVTMSGCSKPSGELVAREGEQAAPATVTLSGKEVKDTGPGRGGATGVSRLSPWEADREYQAAQLSLLERILASQQQSLHLLSDVERSRAEHTIAALKTEIADRRNGLHFGKRMAPPNTEDLQLQHRQAQLAILRQIRARQESELSQLEGQQHELALMVIARLSDDIDTLQRSLATARSERIEGVFKAQDTASSHAAAREGKRWSPKVPFYIPGTSETGTMRLQVSIAEDGTAKHALQFIDDTSGIQAPRDSIALSREDLDELQRGLKKLHAWSTKARREQVRRIFSKPAACFPLKACAAGDSGVSAQVLFTIYEDGATSGQIQLRKGRYQQPYNFSADNALLLQTYITQTLGNFDRSKLNAALSEKSLHEMFQ